MVKLRRLPQLKLKRFRAFLHIGIVSGWRFFYKFAHRIGDETVTAISAHLRLCLDTKTTATSFTSSTALNLDDFDSGKKPKQRARLTVAEQ